MTGGDIFNAVQKNEDYKLMYLKDKMFYEAINSLMSAADEGTEEFSEIVTNMVYSFQTIYASLISIVIASGDDTTIENINKMLKHLMGDEEEYESS